MMKKITKLLALFLALVMVLSCVAGCGKKEPDATEPTKPGNNTAAASTYTYRDYATALGTTWNPHTAKTAGDFQILQYLQTPLVTAVVKDSEQSIYQWVYKAAASITDVTKANQADLTKYKATKGSVFEIKLNENMKWQDGTAITADDYVYSMKALLASAAKNAGADAYTTGKSALAGAFAYYSGTAADYDATVGCYKVDETTFRYVTQNKLSLNEFLLACGTNWLVHKTTYEAGNYGTSLETTVSYGPYKLESVNAGKEVVLVQNENYYQFTKQADGTLSAETDYEVDGEKAQAYQTTKIVITAMTEEEAKSAFMKGELSRWVPSVDEIATYATSEQLRKEDKTETYALFFNTNEASLKKLDTKGNKNSVVLTNNNFRKAFSMAIDREGFATETAGYKPAYNLLNHTFYYDIFNDPISVYRDAPQAMQAMCDIYGVEWVDGSLYGTLEEAYSSISGYYPEEAKSAMRAACNELVLAGLYKKGEAIKISVAYSATALTEADKAQIAKLNEYLNAAAKGSGFGTITLEAVGDVAGLEDKVVSGEYAIGYSAVDGDKLDSFNAMQAFLNDSVHKLQEKGCWDPATEKLTMKMDGESVTMTWKEWSLSMTGNGKYAKASIGKRLDVTSALEREFLCKFYRIPLAAACDVSLQSYQVQDYAEGYNVMYGFGGIELMTYNYTDAQWADYVAKNNSSLGYE